MSIYSYTTGYLVPIKIVINQDKYKFYDTFLYDIREPETMSNVIDKVIFSHKIFHIRNQIGEILKENARKQIESQREEFTRIIRSGLLFNDNVWIHLKCDSSTVNFEEYVEFNCFLDYEPELYGNSICKEFKFPDDTAQYLTFMIRDQIYAYQKKYYYGNGE